MQALLLRVDRISTWLGQLFAWTRLLATNTPEGINHLVLCLLLRVLALKAVTGLQFGAELLGLVVMPWMLERLAMLTVNALSCVSV